MNRKDKYLALLRREIWEHKSLWMAPAAAGGLLVLGAAFGGIHINGPGADIGISGPPGRSGDIGAMSLIGMTVFLSAIAGVAVFSYLLDCLFAERKDRSILFWKSLPVSDAETVVSKLAVAMLLVPLLVLVLALLLQPVIAGIAWLRYEPLRPFLGFELFGGSYAALPRLAVTGLFALLWYAPFATYLMLASVLARRAPMMYASLPPLVLSLVERLTFGTSEVGRFVGERLFPWPTRVSHLLGRGKDWITTGGDWWVVFQDPKLWLGLVAAAGMLYTVIRLRRYRDDT